MRFGKFLLVVVVVMFCMFGLLACDFLKKEDDYLRIHIRANSNLAVDQNVKYVVKEKVVEYLTPYILECENVEDVKSMVERVGEKLENVIDSVLKENGFDYVSEVKLNNEFFPTRTYDNFTLEANYYDAIIVNLGEAKGDNWWCVVYPPLCFKDTRNITYKSKIKELIDKFF